VTSPPESRGGAHKTDTHIRMLIRVDSYVQGAAGAANLGKGRRKDGQGRRVAHLVDAREVSQELDDLRAVEEMWGRGGVGGGCASWGSSGWRRRCKGGVLIAGGGGHYYRDKWAFVSQSRLIWEIGAHWSGGKVRSME